MGRLGDLKRVFVVEKRKVLRKVDNVTPPILCHL